MEDFFLSENLWSLIREELYVNSLDNFFKCYVWEVGVEGDGVLQGNRPSLYTCIYCSSFF